MATRRICLDINTIRHLEREGLGWGHDLDNGCLEIEAARSEGTLGSTLVAAYAESVVTGRLEHVNVTVADPDATAEMLGDLFGWTVRWSGLAIHGGRTVHVGSPGDYLAIYSPGGNATGQRPDSYRTRGGMNHIGVVVDDIDATEAKVRSRGLRAAQPCRLRARPPVLLRRRERDRVRGRQLSLKTPHQARRRIGPDRPVPGAAVPCAPRPCPAASRRAITATDVRWEAGRCGEWL